MRHMLMVVLLAGGAAGCAGSEAGRDAEREVSTHDRSPWFDYPVGLERMRAAVRTVLEREGYSVTRDQLEGAELEVGAVFRGLEFRLEQAVSAQATPSGCMVQYRTTCFKPGHADRDPAVQRDRASGGTRIERAAFGFRNLQALVDNELAREGAGRGAEERRK